MRVIICGAGQVGYNIASYLSREDNDVTLIDQDPALIARVNEAMDANGIIGHASNPDNLDLAGANDADMVIAVTRSDEVNMVACQVAHSLFNVPHKIARIRNQAYLRPAWYNLFSRAHMPIDVIISPEMEVAHATAQLLRVPGTTSFTSLAGGRLYLVSVICGRECPLVNTPLRQIPALFPTLSMNVLAIMRGSRATIPGPDEQMLIGDEVYFVVDARHMRRALSAFGHEEAEARRIVIMGGGNIGLFLAGHLRESCRDLRIKIIERDEDRARFISEQLPDDVIVLHGDGLHREMLGEADIGHTETFLAVTDDDEANILGSLLAKEFGCERVLTLVNKNIYTPLTSSLGIDGVISPQGITVSRIMQHVRRGRIKSVHNIRDGFAEVIEAEASDTCGIIGKPVRELEQPGRMIVGAIIRNDEIIMATPGSVVRPLDRVIILATQDQAVRVEKMFSVQVNIF